MKRHPPVSRATDGFTLLEALVVLVVLALVSAIAWPRLTALSPRLTVQTAAVRLAAELRATRADAMRTGTTRSVTVDMGKRTFWSGDGRLRRLPVAAAVDVAGRNVQFSGPQRALFQFRPDGSSSGGKIALRMGRSTAVVTVDWMTGATSVLPGHRP